jgi:hypothetical protein
MNDKQKEMEEKEYQLDSDFFAHQLYIIILHRFFLTYHQPI